jgi:EpsI family protein
MAMSERKGKAARVVFACALLLFTGLMLANLISTAKQDDHPRAWTGRWPGFAMTGAAFAVTALMLRNRPAAGTHYWGFVGVLTLSALLAAGYSYNPEETEQSGHAQAIPLEFDGWIGQDREVDPVVIRVLETDDIIQRAYQREQDSVGLAVIFSMNKRKAAHPPEQCYAAQGFEVVELEPDSFSTKDGKTVSARRLILMKGGRYQAVLYWYRAGDLSTGNFLRQQIHVILSSLNPFTPAAKRVALIRLTTPLRELSEKKRAMSTLKDFAGSVFDEVKTALD